MAKEMMIVFVYDTVLCGAEDDPAAAVLYFHPGWVSDQQRHALAGQVVGAAHCVKALFSQPVAITLQSGKFILREYGRYILAVGSDRHIPGWVLAARAALLRGLVAAHVGGLAALGASLPARRLPDKLYHVFETFLPVLQYGCHIFQRVPLLTLPKSGASVYMECMQVLDHCRRTRGVLGGLILYNNKIVASQLPPRLASCLAVADPHRVRSPAEPLPAGAALPPGAQLLAVYVGRRALRRLRGQAARLAAFHRAGDQLLADIRQNQEAEREKFPTSGMKRDKSLLFTAVPEEDHAMLSPPAPAAAPSPSAPAPAPAPDVIPFASKPRPRPTKLALSFRTQPSLDEAEGQPFTGHTSVSCTPRVEYRRVLGGVQSICGGGAPGPDLLGGAGDEEVAAGEGAGGDEAGAGGDEAGPERDARVALVGCVAAHCVPRPAAPRRPDSARDLHPPTATPPSSPPSPATRPAAPLTITDPSFPVFRSDGAPISESLFNEYLERHYSGVGRAPSPPRGGPLFPRARSPEQGPHFEGFDSEPDAPPRPAPAEQARRRSLSLPLKSLAGGPPAGGPPAGGPPARAPAAALLTPLMEQLARAPRDASSGYSSRGATPADPDTRPAAHAYVHRDKSSQDESDSESGSECESEEECASESEGAEEGAEGAGGRGAVRCALFVGGLQDAALLALLELAAAEQPAGAALHDLWEITMNSLGPIESKCMDPLPGGAEPTDYSYLTLDPDWGAVRKGGPWPASDIATMGLIHSEFRADPDLSEFILRSEESVVVGAACGGAETYYREAGPRPAGPPPPSDPLAAAPPRARRRLRADHNILLL